MKRVGLLTYFWSNNPGTFLQAYATTRALRMVFPDDQVEVINYRILDVPFRIGRSHLKPGNLANDLHRNYKYRTARRAYLTLSRGRLTTPDYGRALSYIQSLDYDLIVVGSDTLLEPLPIHLRANSHPIYWLPPTLNCKKVMCASSAKALVYEELTEAQRTFFGESLRGFDLIAVRDEATLNLMRALAPAEGARVTQIPDPTFSLDVDLGPAQRLALRRRQLRDQRLVMISLPESYPLACPLAAYYRSKGFTVVRPEQAGYADVFVSRLSPFEWAGLFSLCELVVTDRFHGTVFSLKSGTPVVSVVCRKDLITATGLSKYHSLLKLFDLHETNLVNGMTVGSVEKLIEITEGARHTFPRRAVVERLPALRDSYLGFVRQIPAVLHANPARSAT